MTDPKFTPGPWRFTNGHLPRVTKGDFSICGIHKIGRFSSNDDAEVVRATGLLIAAAPDLYAALVDAIGIMPPEACGPALDALAKARGETS